MRTEYVLLKLKYNTTLNELKTKPVLWDSKDGRLFEVTSGFKYVYYPSLWLRDKFGKPMHDAYVKESVRTRKRNFVYIINTDTRGLYR